MQAVLRLQSEIAQFLSSNEESTSSLQTAPALTATLKPMASVTPQVKSDSSSKERPDLAGTFSSALTDDTANSHQFSDASLKVPSLPNESLPCIPTPETCIDSEMPVDNVWRIANGLRVGFTAGGDCQLTKVTKTHELSYELHDSIQQSTNSIKAVADSNNVLNCNSDLMSSARHSVSDNSPLLDRQSDELTAATVLSGIGQLAAVAAAVSDLSNSDKTKPIRHSVDLIGSSVVGE